MDSSWLTKKELHDFMESTPSNTPKMRYFLRKALKELQEHYTTGGLWLAQAVHERHRCSSVSLFYEAMYIVCWLTVRKLYKDKKLRLNLLNYFLSVSQETRQTATIAVKLGYLNDKQYKFIQSIKSRECNQGIVWHTVLLGKPLSQFKEEDVVSNDFQEIYTDIQALRFKRRANYTPYFVQNVLVSSGVSNYYLPNKKGDSWEKMKQHSKFGNTVQNHFD